MTFRAVVLGLLGAMLVAGLDYLGRFAWPLGLSFETHLPASVLGPAVVVVLAINPVLSRLGRPLRLKGSELAVIVSLCLVGCGLANWTHTLTKAIAMPIQYNQTNPGWQKVDLLSYVPPAMLPAGGQWDARVMDGFLHGLGGEGKPIGLDAIPWDAWTTPLSVWMAIILLTSLAVVGLSLVVHRQWSQHERLRYPIADCGASLLGQQDDAIGGGGIFRNRLFWIGLIVLLAIRMLNYVYTWYPQFAIYIPFQFDFSAVLTRFPKFKHVDGYYFVTSPSLFPIGVAFAFFLASDVALSLGVSYMVFEVAVMILMPLGIMAGGRSYVLGGWDSFMRFGGFVGMVLMLLYTGRRYYSAVLARSAGFRSGETVEPSAVWGLRLAAVSACGVVGILIWLGLNWTLAVLAVGLLLLVFVVVSRVSAESGLFTFRAAWLPVGAITGLLGPAVIGPQAFMILAIFSILMAVDTISTLMPYVVNGLQICDSLRVRVGRAGSSMVAALVAAAAVAVPVCMWVNYNCGVGAREGWASSRVARLPFDTGEQVINRLTLLGQLQEHQRYGAMESFLHPQPDQRFIVCAALGLALVLGLSMLRMRFHWWPIHPILLLTLGTWSLGQMAPSFLLGWIIKQAVTRLGGGAMARRIRPLMIGVIAGELLSGAARMAVSCAYYAITGLAAPGT